MIAITILWCVIVALLVVVTAMVPRRSQKTTFQRTQAQASGARSHDTDRETLLVFIVSLQRVIAALLLMVVVCVSAAAWGWWLGTLASTIVALFYGRCATRGGVRRMGQRLYDRYETSIMAVAERYGALIRHPFIALDTVTTITSRDEFEYSVKELPKAIMSPDERAVVLQGLAFRAKRVRDSVTPIDDLQTIVASEVLGPLVLDDLHKTGHARFVVIDDVSHEMKGILAIRQLLNVRVKDSLTAGDAVEPVVSYIHQDELLERALTLSIGANNSLLVVVDDAAVVVGVIALEDILGELTGRSFHQTADHYDSPRAAVRAYKK